MPQALDLSRRQLLQGLAAAFLAPATGLGQTGDQPGRGRRIVVVGAGAFGGWTALALQRAGANVTLVDAWGPGNARASSGGESRVIRAIYGPDRIYAEMVQEAYPLWEALDATTDDALHVPTGALWMLRSDDDRYVRSSLPIMQELGFPVAEPTLEEARHRWPQINFDGIKRLYFEERAGMLSSRRCCEVVRDRFVELGGHYATARVAATAITGGRLEAITLAAGSEPASVMRADAFVFACGPWLGRLFPDVVGDALFPSRQDVLYFGQPAGSDAYGPERLPVWLDFGDDVLYGLPDAHRRGFKLADDTRGPLIDPDTLERIPDPGAIAKARAFMRQRFPELADAPLIEARVCQYENSPDGQLILDRHPGAENVWLAGGGSGHGFKLGPAVGNRLAGAILGGAELPPAWNVARLHEATPTGTQFDA
ncbi:MAG: FAD-dependent oxidoreductase [Pseudomonadota bacterium]